MINIVNRSCGRCGNGLSVKEDAVYIGLPVARCSKCRETAQQAKRDWDDEKNRPDYRQPWSGEMLGEREAMANIDP